MSRHRDLYNPWCAKYARLKFKIQLQPQELERVLRGGPCENGCKKKGDHRSRSISAIAAAGLRSLWPLITYRYTSRGLPFFG